MSRPALSYTEDPCPKKERGCHKVLVEVNGEGRDGFLTDVALRSCLRFCKLP